MIFCSFEKTITNLSNAKIKRPGLWIRIVLMRIRSRIQIRGGGEGVGQPKMCIPPGKILGTPLVLVIPGLDPDPGRPKLAPKNGKMKKFHVWRV
jgi:hypothetical protein